MTELEPVRLDYAAAPEATDIVHLDASYGLFIGGQFVEPRSGRTLVTLNPAAEGPLATFADGGTEDVDAAVAAARGAFASWSARPGRERAKFLYRIARHLQE